MSKEVLKQLEIAEKALAEVRKLVGKAAPAPVAEEPEAEESATGRILYWGEGETTNLEEMDLKACKAFAKENEVDLGKAKTLEEVRDAIYEAYPDYQVDPEDSLEEPEADDSLVITVVDEDDNEVELDLAEMDLKQLKSFAKEYDITLKMKDADGIRAEIFEAFSSAAEEEPEADAETDDENAEGYSREDIEALDDDELKALCEEHEVEVVTKVSKAKKKVFDREATIEALVEALVGEDQDPAEAYGLNEMGVEELAEILSAHGLSPKGKKEALIDRILENIENGTIELEEEGN